jgi:hypothetical protein
MALLIRVVGLKQKRRTGNGIGMEMISTVRTTAVVGDHVFPSDVLGGVAPERRRRRGVLVNQ